MNTIHKLLIFLSVMALFNIPSWGKPGGETPDFDFPQQVSKDALRDLKGALKSGDGEMVVDALVRFSIARSSVTRESMDTIVDQIETVVKKEQRTDIKSLLLHLEARLFRSYEQAFGGRYRENPEGLEAKDYTEWDRAQFNAKVNELVTQSLAPGEALKQYPLSNYRKIITHDAQGDVYFPTLFQFLMAQNIALVAGSDEPLKNQLHAQWTAGSKGDVPAYLYALLQEDAENYNAYPADIEERLYEEYKDNEHCGLLLQNASTYDVKNNYKKFKDYVARFPGSYYTPMIQSKVCDVEAKSVRLSHADTQHSGSPLAVTAHIDNVNNVNLKLLRVPREMAFNDEIDNMPVSKMQLVDQKTVNVKGTVPFSAKETVEFAGQPYGMYVVIPEYEAGGKLSTLVNVRKNTAFIVHDLTAMDVSVNAPSIKKIKSDKNGETIEEESPSSRIVVVDINSGAPQEGVDVSGKNIKATTGKDGVVEVTRNTDYSLKRGDDIYGPSARHNTYDNYRRYDNERLQVMTDLAVYRPGETVKFAAIFHLVGETSRAPIPKAELRAVLRDPNGKHIDTLDMVTDAFGRVEGQFVIPTDRMNGSFDIRFFKNKKQSIAYHDFDVSEYKAPTFVVDLKDTRSNYTKGQPVKVGGRVETYTGMPVADAQVQLQLRRNEWTWRWRYLGRRTGEVIQDTVVTTDKNGDFTFTFPAELFKENDSPSWYSSYCYQLNALCSDAAGETQEASLGFIIGSKRGISFTTSSIDRLAAKEVLLPLEFNSTDEQEEATGVKVYYSIEDKDKKVVATGTLDSKKPVVDMSALPSGTFTVKAHILGEDVPGDSEPSCKVVLYRATDKQSPVDKNPLWVPESGRRVDDNNVGHITIGVSGGDAHIYYVAASRTRVLSQGWLHYKNGLHDFTIELPNEPNQFVNVQFSTVRDKETYTERVQLFSNVKEKLTVKMSSFRDLLVPGDHERWQFQLVNAQGKPVRGAMLLEMMDKAINDISANSWHFAPSFLSYQQFSLQMPYLSGSGGNDYRWRAASPRFSRCDMPELFMYDEDFFGGNFMMVDYMVGSAAGARLMRAKGEPMMLESVAAENSMMMAADAEDALADMGAAPEEKAQVDEQRLEQVQERETDVKVALWRPMLTSDDNGNLVVEFEAPNYSTTWIMQAIAYTPALYTHRIEKRIITRKPLMVKSSLPRFVRQGDKVSFAANVQNATDEPAAADALVEIFDPRSGKVLERNTFKLQLDSMGTQAVRIDWQVPDTMAMVGFRVKAANTTFGDGEQMMIPVLEAVSPVIETQPFFIDPGTPQFSMQLPQFTDEARVTLEYCDNPVWYCITALPTIFSDNYRIATTLAHSLFAQTLARGIAQSQPQIKEAISYWKAHNDKDSTLVSMLAKNQDLKIGTLLASPWINEADRQTLRMSRLDELMDEQRAAAEHARIVNALKDLQMPDGGFPWYRYPGCESSLWTTHTVLELIGELQHLGYIKDDNDINDIARKALRYYDAEHLKLLKEQLKRSKNDYSGFSDYVYVRTLFPGVALGKENANMIKKCLKSMTKEWKGTNMGNKAFFAITLHRNGEQKVARDIIESLRQFALTKPSMGMYWDNVQNGWRYFDKVAVTATILEAMAEVDPRTGELDQVRKWMLLMKQSNDWGSSSLAADAVYALLSTGSQWLTRNEMPRVTIDGQPLQFDTVDAYLGYTRRQIPATSLATLAIERDANNPAWGAVYSQFRAQMDQIAEHAIEEISITKEFFAYQPDGSLKKVDAFKVGDKVQVRTVIRNNKDLDFVTLTDERGACFEPVDKLSGYRHSDGTWYYLETKDSATNAFFTSLRKGTHVITYDTFVTAPGSYSVGIATVQCQYAPQITAHSAGKVVTVK